LAHDAPIETLDIADFYPPALRDVARREIASATMRGLWQG